MKFKDILIKNKPLEIIEVRSINMPEANYFRWSGKNLTAIGDYTNLLDREVLNLDSALDPITNKNYAIVTLGED